SRRRRRSSRGGRHRRSGHHAGSPVHSAPCWYRQSFVRSAGSVAGGGQPAIGEFEPALPVPCQHVVVSSSQVVAEREARVPSGLAWFRELQLPWVPGWIPASRGSLEGQEFAFGICRVVLAGTRDVER